LETSPKIDTEEEATVMEDEEIIAITMRGDTTRMTGPQEVSKESHCLERSTKWDKILEDSTKETMSIERKRKRQQKETKLISFDF